MYASMPNPIFVSIGWDNVLKGNNNKNKALFLSEKKYSTAKLLNVK